MVVGDAIAQTVIEQKQLSKYDVKRSLRFLFFGTVLTVSIHQVMKHTKKLVGLTYSFVVFLFSKVNVCFFC